MRIGVDGYNLAMVKATGVATYGIELVAALTQAGHRVEGIFGLSVPSNVELRETAFFDQFKRRGGPKRKVNRYRRAWYFARALRPPRPRLVPLSSQVETRGLDDAIPAFDTLTSAARLFDTAFTFFRMTGRLVQLRLPDPPDVMHWTYPIPIAIRGIPNIYTLHDIVPLKLPYTTLDDKAHYHRLLAGCIKDAAQICTVSETSKRDIVERYAIDRDRVTNTYQTATPPADVLDADPAQDAQSIEGIFGLKHRGYFLYFGSIEPKKNVGRLLEAYLSLQSETPLVIVGARRWQSEEELRLMPDDGVSGAPGLYRGHRGQLVMLVDYLPRSLLARLIRGAKAVVFPSLYEGFGLPVLEAMQLGTPVITSTASSLPEIAGDAALLVDPYDVRALLAAMRRLDGDGALGRKLSALGLDRAKLFSRARYQERLTELYRAAMAPR